MDALDLHVEHERRIERDAGFAQHIVGQAHLVGMLDGGKGVAEPLVVGQWLDLLQMVEVEPPGFADPLVEQRCEARVGLRQPASWCDAVGLVVEAVRIELGEIGKDRLHHQVRVQLRDAIHAVAADDGEMRHTDPFAVLVAIAVVDQRDATDQVDVAREALLDFVEKFLVDAVDDAHVTRQKVLKQPDWPGFQCFRHQCVVGVGKDALALAPGLRPEHAVIVAQQAHQFGDTDCRVRVVEVNGNLVGQVVEVSVFFEMVEEYVLQRGGDEEVFLPQTQFATGRGAVVRVEHPRDVLEPVLELGGACIIAGVEGIEVNLCRGAGLPEAQCADAIGAMAGDDIVEGARLDGLGGVPLGPFAVVLCGAAKTHRENGARTRKFPGGTVNEPGIGVFDLGAIDDRLRKHAVFVAHAITPGRQFQRGHRIEEAGGKPAEAAVAERGIRFAFDDVGERRAARRRKGGIRLVAQVKRRERVVQRASDQKLHRHVVDAARLVLAVIDLRLHPAARELVARDHREGIVEFLGVCCDGLGRYRVKQLVIDFGTERGAVNGGFVCIRHSAGTPRYLRGAKCCSGFPEAL